MAIKISQGKTQALPVYLQTKEVWLPSPKLLTLWLFIYLTKATLVDKQKNILLAMESIGYQNFKTNHPIPLSPLLMMLLPSFHAWFNLHRFIRACHHSYKHFPSLWVVLSLQVFIHTVLYVRSQSCCLQPYNRQAQGRSLKRVKSVSLHLKNEKQELHFSKKRYTTTCSSLPWREQQHQDTIDGLCETIKLQITNMSLTYSIKVRYGPPGLN